MKQPYPAFFAISACLLSAPVFAQPSIGGGTCSTSTLNGNYAVMITGRGVTPLQNLSAGVEGVRPQFAIAAVGGALTRAFQAVGTVSFDGLSKASFTLVADTNSATGTAVTWNGTYTVQANCAAAVTINSGGTISLNVMPSNSGKSFMLTGSDSSYAYSGSGNVVAVGCSTSTLAGVYSFTATQGYVSMTQNAVGGAAALVGLAQFDGEGNITTTTSFSGNGILAGATGTAGTSFAGTYSLGSNCVGSGTISNAQFPNEPFNIVVYTGSSTLSTQFYLMIASNPINTMAVGNAFWINELAPAQSEPGAALHRPWRAFQGILAKLFTGKLHKGEAA